MTPSNKNKLNFSMFDAFLRTPRKFQPKKKPAVAAVSVALYCLNVFSVRVLIPSLAYCCKGSRRQRRRRYPRSHCSPRRRQDRVSSPEWCRVD